MLYYLQYLTMFGGLIAAPLFIAKVMFIPEGRAAIGQLICTLTCCSGIATLTVIVSSKLW